METKRKRTSVHPFIKFILGVGAVAVVGRAFEDHMIGRRKVFVSFDYENDKRYKFLLQAWHANAAFDFRFTDASSGEINTNDVGRVKAALTSKIRDADVTLVIIGAEANKAHRDRAKIGFKNWQNFEIAQSVGANNRIVAVKIDRSYESPDELDGAGASWAMCFSDDAITRALRAA